MNATKPQHTPPALKELCAAIKLHNAAPALAEALQAMIARFAGSDPGSDDGVSECEELQQARAALAAAGL